MNASQYIRRIRNPFKRRYAAQYQAWLESGEMGESPCYANLSYLVRLQLRVIFEEQRNGNI